MIRNPLWPNRRRMYILPFDFYLIQDQDYIFKVPVSVDIFLKIKKKWISICRSKFHISFSKYENSCNTFQNNKVLNFFEKLQVSRNAKVFLPIFCLGTFTLDLMVVTHSSHSHRSYMEDQCNQSSYFHIKFKNKLCKLYVCF